MKQDPSFIRMQVLVAIFENASVVVLEVVSNLQTGFYSFSFTYKIKTVNF